MLWRWCIASLAFGAPASDHHAVAWSSLSWHVCSDSTALHSITVVSSQPVAINMFLVSLQVEQLVPLAALADQYDVGLLTRLCQEAIFKHAMDQRCCCGLYLQARQYGMDQVADMCWHHMSVNVSGMLRQGAKDFIQLDIQDLLRLCHRDGSSLGGNSSKESAVSSSGGMSEDIPAASNCAEQQQQGNVRVDMLGAGPRKAPTPDSALHSNATGHAVHFTLPPRLPGSQPAEFVIFQAIVAWVEACCDARLQHLDVLLGCVRFDLMAHVELTQVREHPLVNKCELLGDMLRDAYQQQPGAMVGRQHTSFLTGSSLSFGWSKRH